MTSAPAQLVSGRLQGVERANAALPGLAGRHRAQVALGGRNLRMAHQPGEPIHITPCFEVADGEGVPEQIGAALQTLDMPSACSAQERVQRLVEARGRERRSAYQGHLSRA